MEEKHKIQYQGSHKSFGKWSNPSEREKVAMGLIKAPEAPATRLVAYSKHYGSRAVMWETKWISEKAYEKHLLTFPHLQLISTRMKKGESDE